MNRYAPGSPDRVRKARLDTFDRYARAERHMPQKSRATTKRGFVVFRKISSEKWALLGEFDLRPGSTSRRARFLAIQEATHGKARRGEIYADVPRSEWRVALDWEYSS